MRMVWRATLAALAAATAIVAGCGTTPDSLFYTLTSSEAAPAGTSSVSVVVGPITLPVVVDRPQLVTSSGDNRVELHEFHRWAQPLRTEIPRVVAAQLGRQLGTARTGISSDVAITDPDYRALIDIQRFDLRRGESATVEALWTVHSRSGSTRTGHTLAEERAADTSYDALITAQRRALGTLSRDIAGAIQALQR